MYEYEELGNWVFTHFNDKVLCQYTDDNDEFEYENMLDESEYQALVENGMLEDTLQKWLVDDLNV